MRSPPDTPPVWPRRKDGCFHSPQTPSALDCELLNSGENGVDHVPPMLGAPAAGLGAGSVSPGRVLVQNRAGLRVRGLPREVVPRRPRLRLRHRRSLLPEPVRVSLHVHGGRSRVCATQVSARPPPLHAHQVQGLLSGVWSHGPGLCVQREDLPPVGGVLGEKKYTHDSCNSLWSTQTLKTWCSHVLPRKSYLHVIEAVMRL